MRARAKCNSKPFIFPYAPNSSRALERYIKTLTGEKAPIEIRNPKKDLSINEYRLYNLIKHNPKTLLEIRKHLYRFPVKGLENISDLDRMLRRLRQKDYAVEVPQRKGPQKWRSI